MGKRLMECVALVLSLVLLQVLPGMAQAPRVVTNLDSLDLPFGTNLQPMFSSAIRHLAKEEQPKSCGCSAVATIDTSGRLLKYEMKTDCPNVAVSKYDYIKEHIISLPPKVNKESVVFEMNLSAAFDSSGKLVMNLPMRMELMSFIPAKALNTFLVRTQIKFPITIIEKLNNRSAYYSKEEKNYQINILLWAKVSKNGSVVDYRIDPSNQDNDLLKHFDFSFMKLLQYEPAMFTDQTVECWVTWPLRYVFSENKKPAQIRKQD